MWDKNCRLTGTINRKYNRGHNSQHQGTECGSVNSPVLISLSGNAYKTAWGLYI